MTASQYRITRDQISSLIHQQPLSLLVSAINGVLLAVMLSGRWPTEWLVGWVAAIWLSTALGGAVWWRHRRGCRSNLSAAKAARQLTAVVFLVGLAWGLPGALYPAPQTVVLQGFVVFVIGGMSAGAVISLGGYLPAFFAFILPAFGPTVLRLLVEGTPFHMVMACMALVFLLVTIGVAHRLNQALGESAALKRETRALTEKLDQARLDAEAASASKSSFLAMISHELRTPLNAVLGFGQLMEQQVHGPLGHDKYREYLQHMGESGEHLLQLIDEVMDVSKAETGQLALQEEAVDLARLLESSVELMIPHASKAGLALEIDLAPNLPALYADRRRLRQILLNVLNNAIKFTPEDGQVCLTASRAGDGGVTVAVQDNGIGMSEEDLAVAFELFGRGHNATDRVIEGTGIGLPLTRFLLSLHDGQMDLASEPDKGTLVSLHFPPSRVIEKTENRARVAPETAREVVASLAV